MLDDVASAIVNESVQAAGDIASDSIHKRWGWQGCLSVVIVLGGAIVLLLWSLGVFSR
ncbi:hypothetical protein [Novosphingobium guangzhouense]|uniref:hypothetical protein n=1 Tax=Novosphingobium guangzhouense TaxID=1850347 RepID=UPI001472BCDD|nr:hypothetical protein [Novosphingobium guangzhouense]